MTYTAIKYATQKDALAAFKLMMRRKREWVENTEREFEKLRRGE